ncbi:type VI secretion system ImpA family N-terminal domain-containing protein [Photobacterium sp. 1_MG-2023]|uniref:type VI secretion system ImpA family N-terminal domain-containing protein n=1 Tax=Photobacterium sp. 1_MG-2023 TaxID=3062646 RepID=UPI0026E31A98|nr:type VI secretion system ImpA family N-terminal domain-containing protein [Photobacterium sp. 1_MG-2023]MDO6708565.1 type VI secretion system ImpA family N-terminal domain-containing protein [Photobacterium sp. 1_MG-2023]
MKFTDIALRPISAQSPVGQDPRSLDLFSDLKRNVNRLSSVVSPAPWREIFSAAEILLTSHSKDFRCASYYCVAACRIEGLKGAVNGLSVLNDLCIVYWHTAYPSVHKPNARIQSFDWIAEQLPIALKKIRVTLKDQALVESGHRFALNLEKELQQQLGSQAPSLGPVRRQFTEWKDYLDELAEKEKSRKKSQSTVMAAPTHRPETQSHTNPTETSEKPHKNKQKLPVWCYWLATVFILGCLVFSIAAVRQYLYQRDIPAASAAQLEKITGQLILAEPYFKNRLKEDVLARTNALMQDWTAFPERVYHHQILEQLAENVNLLYPDSIAAKASVSQYHAGKATLSGDYQSINQQFKRARTIIANAALVDDSDNTNAAYKFSNTLFPFLGRLDYLEKGHISQDDILKAQKTLSAYQYRLMEIANQYKEQNQ